MAAGEAHSRSTSAATAATTMTTATATKKTAAATEASIWKNYLAVRTEISVGGSASWRLQFNGGATTQARSRKRSKPSNSHAGSANWMAMSSQSQNRFADESASVAPRIRKYWEKLSAIERQQILFIDEPDLVKQLYKLNLSLLCVGLMQRHLKTPLRATTAAKSATSQTALTAVASGPTATPSRSQPERSEAPTAIEAEAPTAVADTQVEKTYELLEAMEFMDIGTGILTVKSELVEDPERLFTLVGDVLFGFATSIHVLSEKQFYDLFVTESEVINTWEDYQRLIAMLVEQLIVKSYVHYLEKEAAIQMEELLLEVSLEDSKPTRKDGNKDSNNSSSAQSQKSKKKKKKKKKDTSSTNSSQVEKAKYQPEPEDFEEEDELEQVNDENDPEAGDSNPTVVNDEVDADDDDEGMAVDDFTPDMTVKADAEATFPTEDVIGDPVNGSELSGSSSKRASSSSLNPNASVFQPQQEVLQLSGPTTPMSRSPVVGKRKLDKYIVNINIQDATPDDDDYYPSSDGDLDYSSDDDFRGDSKLQRRQSVAQRWRDQEDAELEWQLQQMYSSTSTMLGWDFTRQRELVVQPGMISPWDDSVLWRTAPKEVVRYFSPGGGDNGFGPFFPPPVVGSYPFAPAGSSPQPKSMYYFAPPSSSPGMPLATPFIGSRGGGGPHSRVLPSPPVGGTALPPHQRMFAFHEANFRGVVTSPEFPSRKPELQHDRLLRKDHPDPE